MRTPSLSALRPVSAGELRRGGHAPELGIEVGRRDARHLVGTQDAAAIGGKIERVGGVDRERHVEAEVGAHPGGGLTAHLRLDAADGDGADIVLSQPGRQVGAAVEGGVHVLRDQQIRLSREHVLEGVAGMVAAERVVGGLLLEPVVADEHDRLAALAPGVDERADVALAVRVVARAPGGIVERSLDVKHDEGGALHRAGA